MKIEKFNEILVFLRFVHFCLQLRTDVRLRQEVLRVLVSSLKLSPARVTPKRSSPQLQSASVGFSFEMRYTVSFAAEMDLAEAAVPAGLEDCAPGAARVAGSVPFLLNARSRSGSARRTTTRT